MDDELVSQWCNDKVRVISQSSGWASGPVVQQQSTCHKCDAMQKIQTAEIYVHFSESSMGQVASPSIHLDER